MTRATNRGGQRSRQGKKRYTASPSSTGRVARGRARRQRSSQQRRRQFEAAITRLDPQVVAGLLAGRMRAIPWAQLGTGWHLSKLVSLLLLAGVCASLIAIHTQDRFFLYREDIQFEALTYLDAAELYDFTGVEGWSVFWLDPEKVRDSIQKHPYVDDADVAITIPGAVSIAVQEAEPSALWVTDRETLWLLADGTALPMRHENMEGLLQIFDGPQAAQDAGRNITTATLAVDQEVVTSAIRVAAHFPGLAALRYNEDYGLNFGIPEQNTWIYWGDGSDSEKKLQNLLAVQKVLREQGRTTSIIDLRYPDNPYFQ